MVLYGGIAGGMGDLGTSGYLVTFGKLIYLTDSTVIGDFPLWLFEFIGDLPL